MGKGLLRKFLLSIAVGAVLALALVGAAAANSPSSTVSFAGNATLVSNPGTALVALKYSCAGGVGPGGLFVDLDENGVIGTNTVTATCDGKTHSVTVPVPGAFTPGAAVGQAEVFNSDFTSFAIAQSNVTIR